METKLLDTTFLIHHWGGHSDAKAYLEAQPDHTEYLTTTVNLKELAVGRKLTGEFDLLELEAQFRWVDVVPITKGTAWAAADLEAPLHAAAETNQDKINSVAGDVLIAGAAIEHGATVVSKNVADFEALGASVEPY
jgi:predicted nucleic acid-binding protein